MISLSLSLLLCGVSILPAWFDHGERKKAFADAVGFRARWEAGLKWIVINWGLPLLALMVTIIQGLESAATDREIAKLKSQAEAASWSQISAEDVAKMELCLRKCPKGRLEIVRHGSDDARLFANQVASIFRNCGWTVNVLTRLTQGSEGQVIITPPPDVVESDLKFVLQIIAGASNRTLVARRDQAYSSTSVRIVISAR